MNLFDETVPIAAAGLPEQAGSGIPRRIVALHEPAPFAVERQHYPGWHGERTGEMRRRGIDADHQVQVAHDGSRLVEIGQLGIQHADIGKPFQQVALLVGQVLLQGDEADFRMRRDQRQISGEFGRAIVVVVVRRITAPDEADGGDRP